MSLWPQHDAEGYYIGKSDDYGSGTQPNNTASMDDWPEIIPGFIPRKKADGPGWDQVEDHKGKEGYVDGTPQTIKDYGPLPTGWSDTPPEPTPEDAVRTRMAQIDAEIRELEQKAIRPMLAIETGTDEPYDHERKNELVNQIIDLRCERQMLEILAGADDTAVGAA